MKDQHLIEIRTGSDSDIPKIEAAYTFLDSVGIPYTRRILSAHRTPGRVVEAARSLLSSGYKVSIAAAGGAAHLAGMTAPETLLPVIGLPVMTTHLRGMDSLYSMIQMPDGVPVGCVGIGEAKSAAIVAAQIAYHDNIAVRNRIRSARGLEDKLHGTVGSNLPVAVIKPDLYGLFSEKYAAMLALASSLGLEIREYPSTKPGDLRELAYDGVAAIISFGIFDGSGIFTPRNIAERTDIPVIAVPVTEGVVAGEYGNTDGIFTRMLGNGIHSDLITIPVAGMGINQFKNAVLFAAQIVGLYDGEVQFNVGRFISTMAMEVEEKDRKLQLPLHK